MEITCLCLGSVEPIKLFHFKRSSVSSMCPCHNSVEWFSVMIYFTHGSIGCVIVKDTHNVTIFHPALQRHQLRTMVNEVCVFCDGWQHDITPVWTSSLFAFSL